MNERRGRRNWNSIVTPDGVPPGGDAIMAKQARVDFPGGLPPAGLPGARPGIPSPRLPSLGGYAPSDPPMGAPSGGPAEAIETFQKVVTLDVGQGSMASVYTTQHMWGGCDVFVSLVVPQQTFSFTNVRVVIFAVGENAARAVVAQASISGPRLFGTGTATIPTFACSARTLASRYEVVLSTEDSGVGVSSFTDLQVTVVASDRAVTINDPAPNDCGFFRGPDAFGLPALQSLLLTGPMRRGVGVVNVPLFLRALHAVNTNANPGGERWLQVHDTGLTAPPAGNVPIYSFQMTPSGTLGSEIHIDVDGPSGELFRDFPFQLGPYVAASSTALTYTAANAGVGMIGWLR